MEATLSEPSLHPTLSISLPASLLRHHAAPSSATSSDRCSLNVLLHLPPNVFFDPYTSHWVQTDPRIAAFDLLGPTELEKPVGWSRFEPRTRSAAKGSRNWWSASDDQDEEGIDADDDDEQRFSEMIRDALRSAIRGETARADDPLRAKRAKAFRFDSSQKPSERSAKSLADLTREHTSLLVRLDASAAVSAGQGNVQIAVPLHIRYMPARSLAQPHRLAPPSSADGVRHLAAQLLPYSDVLLSRLRGAILLARDTGASVLDAVQKHAGTASPSTLASRQKARSRRRHRPRAMAEDPTRSGARNFYEQVIEHPDLLLACSAPPTGLESASAPTGWYTVGESFHPSRLRLHHPHPHSHRIPFLSTTTSA